MPAFDLVLFDLDGTLADTAPDLAAAANRMRQRRGLDPLPLATLRPMASHGARGLIGAAFGVAPAEPQFESLRVEFLTEYESNLCIDSHVFPAMVPVLDAFDRAGLRWGIVTNKIARYTDPLVRALQLHHRAACVVSGDTTPHAKPHPEPLRHALRLCAADAARALYVGDDRRDVQSGRAAGLRTIAVRYGYLGDGDPIESWGADHLIASPTEMLPLVLGHIARSG